MARFKFGLFGTGRGIALAQDFLSLGCELVAMCDFHEARLNKAVNWLKTDAKCYDNFDEFIEHDMDIVILANFFHEHAPYAIKCLEKGIHVYSECISNGTMAEGVALMEAAEKSNAVYMLAENYPQMNFNMEMQKVIKSGNLGRIVYAEGEYNHPMHYEDFNMRRLYNYFPDHWRSWCPTSYYVTHSIGPLMRATGASPKKVSAFAAFADPVYRESDGIQVTDSAAIITTYNDDKSVFKVTGCAGYGAHGSFYRFCGTKGQIENLRSAPGTVMTRYNSWEKPEGSPVKLLYEASYDDPDIAKISKSGHGGSDYITARIFLESIEKGEQPPFPYNVDAAIAMSSVAILGHRSILEGGKSFEIPNFREEKWKEIYRNDTLSPIPGSDGTRPSIPCSSVPNSGPNEEQCKKFFDEIKDMPVV